MTRNRTKIRSKTRSDSSQKSEEDIIYCICRSSDGTRFMIACDNCEEWYHGDCINVTPKQANNIKRFFCHLCIGRNPCLEIEYKTIKDTRPRLPNLRQQIKKINFSSDEENDADLSSSSSPDKCLTSVKSKRPMRKRWHPSMSESIGKRRRGRPKEDNNEYDEEATEDEIETLGYECVKRSDECTFRKRGYSPIERDNRIVSDQAQKVCDRSQRSLRTDNYSTPFQFCGVNSSREISKECEICKKYDLSSLTKNQRRKRGCICPEVFVQSRRSYNSKDNNSVDEEEYSKIVDGDYNRQKNMRRQSEFEIGVIRQRLTNPNVANNDCSTIGSKMRRGDHLPGGGNGNIGSHRPDSVMYKCYDDESVDMANRPSFAYSEKQHLKTNNSAARNSSNSNRIKREREMEGNRNKQVNDITFDRIKHEGEVTFGHIKRDGEVRYNRVKREGQGTVNRMKREAGVTQRSSNTSSVSGGQMSSRQYRCAEDSEEDMMISPDLMSSPINGFRHQESEMQSLNNYPHHNPKPPKANLDIEVKNYHYGLNYPDHLYCKHHRSYDWLIGSLSSNVNPQSSTSNIKRVKPKREVELVDGNNHDRNTDTRSLSKISRLTNRLVGVSDDPAYEMIDLNRTSPALGASIPDQLAMRTSSMSPSMSTSSSASSLPISHSQHNNTGRRIGNLHHSAHTPFIDTAQHTNQEFYTINDEDDLEINWPKETVNV